MQKERTIAFHTLGCKLNFAESSSLSRLLEKDGFRKINFEDGADVYVINTCSVTENADKECRSVIRRAKRYAPQSQVIVVGCYAQLKPGEIASMEGVDLVLGANEKFRVADYLKHISPKKSLDEKAAVYSCDISEVNLFESSFSFGERTRAFLKVQDGCDYSCTYCTIPLARGKSRSDSVAHAVEQARLLAELGIKEIVLTGVNIGDFGLRNGMREESFLNLIQKLDEVDGIRRFRISSIEPNLLKDEIIEFVAHSTRFMPHFHVPLQSGSDEVLRRMKRRYLTSLYYDRIGKIKSAMPHACIGADVIVGFPGETEKEFLDTYRFLNELEVSYLHVFTYSERENTEAAYLANPVSKRVRHERNKMLRILSEKKKNAFYRSQLGSTKPVLFESKTEDGMTEGFTDNYVKVKSAGRIHSGEVIKATLMAISGDWVMAALPDDQLYSSQNLLQSLTT
ncbi:MAG: tRNA (N(6)-L-threonylcarbamoyladenosine(37)-C(2))-methylthiotransferase MtaB [Bacteroidetes bacterium]|nr:tRNA (N(6)-L-threonylcarbamoyladenosine(37)-C(2))-methylthiotransferase MtaB [Bacteroidota bacterium]